MRIDATVRKCAQLTSLILLPFFAAPSLAQTTTRPSLDQFLREDLGDDRIVEALRNNRPKDALSLLEPGIKSGDPKFQVMYAAILREYLQDYEGALHLLRLAKGRSEPSAYHVLAQMYREGQGVVASPQEAHELSFFAAAQNHRDAQIDLGASYLLGDVSGLPNYAEGLYWVARASTAGDSRATEVVREVEKYLSGQCNEARRLRVSPELIERFCVDWTLVEYAKPVVSEDCNTKLVGETFRREFRLAKGAAEGWAECAFQLGRRNYIIGQYTLAHRWFLLAALKNHSTAEYMLGAMYSNGKASADTPARTRERVEFWWSAAARNGDEDAVAKVRELGIDVSRPNNIFGRSRLLELGYDLPRDAAADMKIRRSEAVAALEASGSDIVGTWRQGVLVDAEYRYLATFKVAKVKGEYQMYPLEQLTEPGVVLSVAIHSISFDGQTWRFVSEWGEGRRGTFHLTMVSENRFEGFVWIGGVKENANRWDRIR